MVINNQTQSKSKESITLSSFYRELAKVEGNQRLLVIVTHGFVELLVNTVIDAHCKHGKKKITSNNRDFSHYIKLVLLSELGLLDDELYRILDWFRKLRNTAAHEVLFKLTPYDIKFVNKSMNRFLPKEVAPVVKDVDQFCKLLIGTFWNKHLDVLLPIFEPKLHKKKRNTEKST